MGAFDRFLAAFPIRTGGVRNESWSAWPIEGFEELMSTCGGSTFERGLYRLHTSESSENAAVAVGEAFPELVSGTAPFGFDWLGRQFAVDLRHGRDRNVLLLEPGTGEILEIPLSFADFHNLELVDEPEAALAQSFFGEWVAANPTLLPLAPDVCVGYEIPLFLGGGDEVENLAPVDLWVYWSISGQLLLQRPGLEPGTTISSVTIE